MFLTGMMGPVQGMAPMQPMQQVGFGGMAPSAAPGYMTGKMFVISPHVYHAVLRNDK